MFLPPPGRDPLAHAVRQGEQAETDGAASVPAGVLADGQAVEPGELDEGPREAPAALG